MLESFHFLRPLWLLVLPPTLALLWYWAQRQRSGGQFEGRIDPTLLAVLLDRDANTRHNITPLLLAAGMCLALLALAGPTWERLPQPVERDADGLVIVLDLSLSMYVKDVSPSRLVRARQKVTDTLRLRRQGFTGLIAYAGDAHAVAPLTDDTDTIANLLAALSPEMMPVLGSDAGAAIELAQELLQSAGMQQGRILLVTDGIDRLADVTSQRSRDYPLSVLGVGTAEGAPIPLDFANQPGRVLQTQQGDIIRARLDEDRLREVAELGYGQYRTAELGDADIQALLSTQLPGDTASIDSERRFDQWADRGYWLALLLLPLLAAGFRKGTFVGLPPVLATPLVAGAILSLLPTPAHAGWWQDLWQRTDQQAHQALIEGSPERAATLFEDRDWRGIANYRSGEYQAASEAFSAAIENRQTSEGTAENAPLPVTETYNLGNAQARLGQFQAAIDAYDKVLNATPEHEDATFNKALVEKLLQQQQGNEESNPEDQQDQGQQGEQPQDNNSSNNDPQGQPEDPNNEQESQSADNDSKQQEQQPQQPEDEPQEQEQQEAQASRDENTEAMEQWLRRVPDDPGGLLRRKFQYETNQRLRNGEARRQDDQKIW
ncbi:MAG: VWA domain-containing protein [Pseudomonadales bacterium]